MTRSSQPEIATEIVDLACSTLADCGILSGPVLAFDADLFRASQRRIERGFEVPRTTISPIMRRFLFHVGYVTRSNFIYGAGTYVGFAFAWLICGRQAAGGHFSGRGVDCNPSVLPVAKRNFELLPKQGTIELRTADALMDLADEDTLIDLLFIDVDAPDSRKSLYLDILIRAKSRLRPGALILAHDPLVSIFTSDFERYHHFIQTDERLGPTCILPLDECGVSITACK